ncbi:MAG: WYL domain-containing transcriptional regulator [Clostridia bacterium]
MTSNSLKPMHLMDVLRELTDAQHRLTVPQLTEELLARGVHVERKSVYRYIGALIEYGVDIVKSGSGYYLNKREFELQELNLLSYAIQSAAFISAARSHALIQKLSCFLSRNNANPILIPTISVAKYDSDEVYHTMESISLAIAAKRQITFSYYKRDINKRNVVQRSGERYRVSPYAIVFIQGQYNLVCNLEERDDLTHFRLDQICSVRIDTQPWRHFSDVTEYHTIFDAADYASKCINTLDGIPIRITLCCAASLIGDILERFGDDIPVQPHDDGRFTATVFAAPGLLFLGWAAQYGNLVEIIDPPELRAQMRRRLESTLKLY